MFKAPYLQWYLAKSSNDDCDVVCTAHGKVCYVNALQFDYVALSGNYVDLFAAASSAGISCNNGGGVGSISAPIYHNGNCYQYNTPSNQVCSGSVGFGLRICPCLLPPSPPPPPPPLFLTSLIEYATQPKFYASAPADNDYFGVSVS